MGRHATARLHFGQTAQLKLNLAEIYKFGLASEVQH